MTQGVEIMSLTASGKKLHYDLVIVALRLDDLRPEGREVNVRQVCQVRQVYRNLSFSAASVSVSTIFYIFLFTLLFCVLMHQIQG